MSSIAAKYTRILGKYGYVSPDILSMELCGDTYDGVPQGVLEWKTPVNIRVRELTPEFDFETAIPQHFESGTVKALPGEAKAVLVATFVAEGIFPRKRLQLNRLPYAQKALETYSDRTLPLWRSIEDDPFAVSIVEKALADLQVRIARMEAHRAAVTLSLNIWAAEHGAGHLVHGGELTLTAQDLESLTRELQEDVAVYLIVTEQVDFQLKAAEKDVLLAEIPVCALQGLGRAPLDEEDSVYSDVQANLFDPLKWETARKDVALLAENPIQWVEAGRNRDIRRKRALSLPQERVDAVSETDGVSEMVRRTAALMTRTDEFTDEGLVAEMSTLSQWGRILCVRTGGEKQNRFYTAMQEALPARGTDL